MRNMRLRSAISLWMLKVGPAVYRLDSSQMLIERSIIAIKALKNTGKFSLMDKDADEDEHSLEMHLPYIRHVFANA